jgi:hypothetical protein
LNRDGIINLGAYLVGVTAIGGGVCCAVSAAWASVVVGLIVLGTVFASRMGGRKE